MKAVKYLSLVKFGHTVFSLPFALIGFFLGVVQPGFHFSWFILSLIILAVVFARNTAMGFNRYIDKEYDRKNPRTLLREMPSGILNPRSVLIFVFVNAILFITIAWFINSLCFYLSPAALAIILGYSLTKRFTALCHLILGLGLSIAPIGAYLAVTAKFDLLPLLFSATVIFWVAGFDIIYALQDEQFDKSENLYSIPALLGVVKALRVSELLHLIAGVIIVFAGYLGEFGIFYWMGTVAFLGLLFFQHLMVKLGNLKKVNLAFFTTNGIASVIFAVFVICDLLLF